MNIALITKIEISTDGSTFKSLVFTRDTAKLTEEKKDTAQGKLYEQTLSFSTLNIESTVNSTFEHILTKSRLIKITDVSGVVAMFERKNLTPSVDYSLIPGQRPGDFRALNLPINFKIVPL